MHARRWGCCAFFLLLLSLSCSAPVSDEPDSSEPPAADEAAAVADAGDKITAEEAAGDAADATPPEPAKKPDEPKPEPVKMDKPPRPMKGPNPALRNPSLTSAKAPATFKAKFETTKGDFVVEVTREWSPRGADRFYNLVKIGYFRNIAFFRVIEGFMAQFGMHGDPIIGQKWSAANIQDDPVVKSNQRGYISFAKTNMPHSRSVQFFINYKDNGSLDSYGFSPFGQVIEGMEVVDSVYKGYGEGAPSGRGPSQGRIRAEGNGYLKRDFPKLDYIKKATLLN